MSDNKKERQLSTRYPEDVHQAIKVLAEQHDRSFNGEVIHALRSYISGQRDLDFIVQLKDGSLLGITAKTNTIRDKNGAEYRQTFVETKELSDPEKEVKANEEKEQ